jgi:hypothetical protein
MWASSCATVFSAADPGVDGPGLGLQGVADRVVVEGRAVRVERVRAEALLEEIDHGGRRRRVGQAEVVVLDVVPTVAREGK